MKNRTLFGHMGLKSFVGHGTGFYAMGGVIKKIDISKYPELADITSKYNDSKERDGKLKWRNGLAYRDEEYLQAETMRNPYNYPAVHKIGIMGRDKRREFGSQFYPWVNWTIDEVSQYTEKHGNVPTFLELLGIEKYNMPTAIKKLVRERGNKEFENIHAAACSRDSLRPKLMMTNWMKTSAVSTDAMILLHTVLDGVNEQVGLFCTSRKCKADWGTSEFKDKYPDWKAVVPENPYSIEFDVNALYQYVKNVVETEYSHEESEGGLVVLRCTDEVMIGIDPHYVMQAIEGMIELGHSRLSLTYENAKRALIMVPAGKEKKVKKWDTDFYLIMPKHFLGEKTPVYDLKTNIYEEPSGAKYDFGNMKTLSGNRGGKPAPQKQSDPQKNNTTAMSNTEKYLRRPDVRYVLVKNAKSSKPFEGVYDIYLGTDVFTGAHFAKGGALKEKISSRATYHSRDNTMVINKSGKISMDKKSGVWLRNGAKPIGQIEKSDAIDVSMENSWEEYLGDKNNSSAKGAAGVTVDFEPTVVRQVKSIGWKATTYGTIEGSKYRWEIQTVKTSDNAITSVARGVTIKKGVSANIVTYSPFVDPSITLEKSRVKATEKAVRDQHDRALKKFREQVANGDIDIHVDGKKYQSGGIFSSDEFKATELRDYLKQKFPYSFKFEVELIRQDSQGWAYLISDEKTPWGGLDLDNLPTLSFPKSHDMHWHVYQGDENTYFSFKLVDDSYNWYKGTFGFKDRGDVPKSYVSEFIKWLCEQYGFPIEENGAVMKNGGVVESLEKELQRLQRDLNSSRLSTYTLGDDSEEEHARQRERESKLSRFNEVRRLLNEATSKYAKGGTIPNGLGCVVSTTHKID